MEFDTELLTYEQQSYLYVTAFFRCAVLKFQSHQIFHMFVVAAAAVHLYGMYVVASNRPVFEQYCVYETQAAVE